MTSNPKFWCVVPAAGIGTRMKADVPKQYLPLNGRMVIEHTLERLCGHKAISGVVVAHAPNDGHLKHLQLNCSMAIMMVEGGAERCHSVLNGLRKLSEQADDNDWVLVHDAARPCVRSSDIDKLINSLKDHKVGGLLGIPVRDTMKRTDTGEAVYETVNRIGLWHAHTPQMFRLGLLKKALQDALDDSVLVTDEAAAMERQGFHPLMVEGHDDNIKITRPEDLILAGFYLKQQDSVSTGGLDDGE